jgi:hypothetical protein
MGGQLIASADHIAYVGFLDAHDRGDRAIEQRRQLARLLPHISRSVQIMLHTDSLHHRIDAHSQALDAAGPAVVTLTARRRVVTATATAPLRVLRSWCI